MTDLTLSISAALRDAQLQRLEAALASKAAELPLLGDEELADILLWCV